MSPCVDKRDLRQRKSPEAITPPSSNTKKKMADRLLGNGKIQKNDDEDWDLHTVLVNSHVPLEDAREISKQYIPMTRNKCRLTKTHYRFRNLPKTKFSEFRTKKINKVVSLVYGKLK